MNVTARIILPFLVKTSSLYDKFRVKEPVVRKIQKSQKKVSQRGLTPRWYRIGFEDQKENWWTINKVWCERSDRHVDRWKVMRTDRQTFKVVCLSVYSHLYMPNHMYVWTSPSLSVYLHVWLSASPNVRLSACISFCSFVCLSVNLYV